MELDVTKFAQMFCGCLIDQNRYIGDDPVGHSCMNKATLKLELDEVTLYMCDTCNEMLINEPERLDFFFVRNSEALNAKDADNT